MPLELTGGLITLVSQLLGREFRREGRDLQKLGLTGLSAAAIGRLVENGL